VRVLVTGASGQLGQDLVPALSSHDVVAVTRAHCDVADRDAVLSLITTVRPDVIVHAAAFTAVDACESQPDKAWSVNALGTRHVTEAARVVDAYLCVLSTDYVFDGRSTVPYVEWDATAPLSVYGRSKLAAEREALTGASGACVVRTSWLCGAGGPNFVATMVRLAGERSSDGRRVPVVNDQHGCPTFTADLAGALRRLVTGRFGGTFHVTNQGPTTWYEVARATFAAAGADPDRVVPISTAELDPPRLAPRPAYSVLDNAALRLSGLPVLDDWHDPLNRLVKELVA
jgi:dTDP-4-dehydrorhamnose reductase